MHLQKIFRKFSLLGLCCLILLFTQLITFAQIDITTLEPITVENADQLMIVDTLLTTSGDAMYVDFRADGYVLASTGFQSGIVDIWDIRADNKYTQLTGPTDTIWMVEFSPNGQYIAGGSWDDTLTIWDLTNLDSTPQIFTTPSDAFGLGFSPDGTLVTFGDDGGRVYVYEVDSGEEVLMLNLSSWAYDVSIGELDGQLLLAAATLDGQVTVIDIQTEETLFEIDAFTQARRVEFSPDGTMLATSGYADGGSEMRIWSTISGNLIADFDVDDLDDGTNAVVWSPDSSLLLTASYNGLVHVFDAVTGALLNVLEVPTGWASSVAINADMTLIAVSTREREVVLWGIQ